MKELPNLFRQNRAWAARIEGVRPGFFHQLSLQQTPGYFWIGCADSRVPANEIVDVLPGEVFVHRNVANQIQPADISCMSCMQFAVDTLKVAHVIVCGHYGCGGVEMALDVGQHGPLDHWLQPMREIRARHADLIDSAPDPRRRADRLCELNVIEQVLHAGRSPIVQGAWARGQRLSIHGWIYSLENGLLRDIDLTSSSCEALLARYDAALSRITTTGTAVMPVP